MNRHPLDVSDFRTMILESPDQFRTGFEIAKEALVDGSFKSIMISGMGGSALPGGLFRAYLNDLAKQEKGTPVAVYQNRSYGLLPESYEASCLNLICSYSGNTEETISAFQEALDAKLPCIALSAGGKIEEMCRENGVPHVKLPLPSAAFQPRMGTGYFFSVLLQILINQGMVPDTKESILESAEKLKGKLPELEAAGKGFSQKLVGKTPVVYAPSPFQALAMVWKIKINENAKTPAFWNFFPELSHNEMVGFSLPQAKFLCIMLRDPEDHPKDYRRFEVTAGLLREKGVEAEILDLEGENAFEKMFSSIILGDFTSYYLALEYGQDPTPVDMVEELKKLLAE